MPTVPYEGGNFANSKMDNFSLIFGKTSLKIIGMFCDVNAEQGSVVKGEKSFLNPV